MKIKQYLNEKSRLVKGVEIGFRFPTKELAAAMELEIEKKLKAYADYHMGEDQHERTWTLVGDSNDRVWGLNSFKNNYKSEVRLIKDIAKKFEGIIKIEKPWSMLIKDVDVYNKKQDQRIKKQAETMERIKKEKKEQEIYHHKQWVNFIEDLKNWFKLQLLNPAWIRVIDKEGDYQKRIRIFMMNAVKTIHKDLMKVSSKLEHKYDVSNESTIITRIDDYLNEARGNSPLVKNFNELVNNRILKQELKIFIDNQMHMDWIHKEIKSLIRDNMKTVKNDFKKESSKWKEK